MISAALILVLLVLVAVTRSTLPCRPGWGMTLGACAECAAGRASPGDHCVACPAGRHAQSSGASECTACWPGTFSDRMGTSACSVCAAGRAQGLRGATGCVDCMAGRFAAGSAASTCIECPVHSVSPGQSRVTCTVCVRSTYPASNMTTCVACPAVVSRDDPVTALSCVAYGSIDNTSPHKCPDYVGGDVAGIVVSVVYAACLVIGMLLASSSRCM